MCQWSTGQILTNNLTFCHLNPSPAKEYFVWTDLYKIDFEYSYSTPRKASGSN
jgi:hypothetical protein